MSQSTQIQSIQRKIDPIVVIIALLVLLSVITIYGAGVNETFILDDAHNISPIAENPELPLLVRVKDYAIEQNAGPTGRPVAALTFFLNANEWPTSARPFKYTNILIHVFAGILVGILSNILLTALNLATPRQRHLASIFAATIWLLHPIQVSTTLYVVQRMTQLYTLFLLAAATLYVYLRLSIHRATLAVANANTKANATVSRAQWFGLWVGCGVCVMLALGSKETAIVFPLLVIALDVTVLSHLVWPATWGKKLWRGCAVALPLALFAAYTATTWSTLGKRFAIYNYDLAERLLTQPRVLFDYLATLAIPRVRGLSLFHDDFIVSRGLIEPVTTLIAIGALIGAIALAIIFRKKFKVLAFMVLWFFGAHALEASVLPIELYFEHRNYLPSVSLAFASSAGLLWLMQRSPATARVLAPALALVLAVFCLQSSLAWKTPLAQAAIWADEHPQSLRAQMQFSAKLREARAIDESLQVIEPSRFTHPASMHYVLHAANSCLAGRPPRSGWHEKSIATVGTDRAWQWLPNQIQSILQSVDEGRCDVDSDSIIRVLDAHLDEPVYRQSRSIHYNLLHLKTQVLANLQHYGELARTLDHTIELFNKPQSYLTKSQLALNLNDLDLAEKTASEGLNRLKDLNTPSLRQFISQFHSVLERVAHRRAARSDSTALNPIDSN